MNTLLIACFIFLANICTAQKIASGTYFMNYIDMEYQGKIYGKCKVIVNGTNKKVISISGCHCKPKELIQEGKLIKHKTGVWIISKTIADKNNKEIGGCSGGPTIINFKMKRYESC